MAQRNTRGFVYPTTARVGAAMLERRSHPINLALQIFGRV